ncbi:MAG: hypothetical protein M3494_10430 [Actinomycetota bacterium]|jgi:hypothetical protein|nr:hypothetical protein [Actinomycetota bacterium]
MPEPEHSPKNSADHISGGANAAKTLAEACESSPSVRLEVVRGLARDIERHLAELADETPTPGILAEAAQKCSDLATLAACNAGELDDHRAAAETIRLAAEATHSLSHSAEEDIAPDGGESDELVRRDARSASWKASLAARQFDEPGG